MYIPRFSRKAAEFLNLRQGSKQVATVQSTGMRVSKQVTAVFEANGLWQSNQ